MHDVAVVASEQFANLQTAETGSVEQGGLTVGVFMVDVAAALDQHLTGLDQALFGGVEKWGLVYVVIIVQVEVVLEHAGEEIDFTQK